MIQIHIIKNFINFSEVQKLININLKKKLRIKLYQKLVIF